MPNEPDFSLSADNYVKMHPGAVAEVLCFVLVYLVRLIGLASRELPGVIFTM